MACLSGVNTSRCEFSECTYGHVSWNWESGFICGASLVVLTLDVTWINFLVPLVQDVTIIGLYISAACGPWSTLVASSYKGILGLYLTLALSLPFIVMHHSQVLRLT